MPHYAYSRGARRKKLFTRISSTFIKNKPNSNSSILELGNKLHSKSTYFYRWGSSHKLSSSLGYVVPSVCGLALLVGGMITFNPTLSSDNRVHATSIGEATNPGDGDTTPSISIAFPTTGLPEGYNNSAEQTTIVTPGVVAYRSNYFDVTVKNPSWYAVSVRAAKGYTSELKNADSTNPAAIISGVGENVTPNNFKENTWGYALTKVDSSSTAVDDTVLQYSTLPDENSTLIDRPGYTTSANVSEHYKVSFASLFSGDIPSGHYTTKVYLSAVTDPGHLTSAFGDITTMQNMTKVACQNAKEHTSARLRDTRDNKFYWATKLKDGNCWMTQNLDYDGGGTKIEEVSNWTSTDGTASNYYDPGMYYFIDGKTRRRPIDNTTSERDLHYSIGNYYSWNAANSSVCPYPWHLPSGTSGGDFYKLMLSYNIVTGSVLVDGGDMQNSPFYFTYAGNLIGGNNNSPGSDGTYWSSNALDTSTGYYLSMGTSIHPSSQWYRYIGMSVRCVLESL